MFIGLVTLTKDATPASFNNPEKDFVAPRRLGWDTVRLRLPGQLRNEAAPPTGAHAPAGEAASFARLRELLFERCRPEAA